MGCHLPMGCIEVQQPSKKKEFAGNPWVPRADDATHGLPATHGVHFKIWKMQPMGCLKWNPWIARETHPAHGMSATYRLHSGTATPQKEKRFAGKWGSMEEGLEMDIMTTRTHWWPPFLGYLKGGSSWTVVRKETRVLFCKFLRLYIYICKLFMIGLCTKLHK